MYPSSWCSEKQACFASKTPDEIIMLIVELWLKKCYTNSKQTTSLLYNQGYFHPVGAIFTPWGKIYPFEDKMKWAALCTMAGLPSFGKQLTWWFIFESSPNFPQSEKTQKLVINVTLYHELQDRQRELPWVPWDITSDPRERVTSQGTSGTLPLQ